VLERDVAPGIHRVEHAYTNWYLVEDAGHITIVDAGFPRSWALLRSALDELGRTPADVEAVVLTHAHADHVGFAERVRIEWDVPVWLHERERSLSRHPLNYEKEHGPLRHRNPKLLLIAAAMVRAGVLKTPPIGDARAFAEEVELDVPGRPRPVFTPGHTHGHTALHFPDRGTVIAGDALATAEPYTGKRGPRLMSGASCVDSMEAMASLARIADTGARTVLVGHGPPWTGGAREAVERAREAGPS
jgi:glyoxylase-like metal-dependent hydrolase (beta-lactamase superfamily II)